MKVLSGHQSLQKQQSQHDAAPQKAPSDGGRGRQQLLFSCLLGALLSVCLLRSGVERFAPRWAGTRIGLRMQMMAKQQQTEAPRCEYGALPGRWVSRGGTPPEWRILDANCSLRPLLATAAASPPPHGARKPGVLLIGDSVDRHVVEAACPEDPQYFAPESDEGPRWRSLWCSLPGLDVAIYSIWGIFARGPYQEDYMEPRQVRIPRATRLFRERFGRSPDMVVLASNFWDIGAMTKQRPEWLESRDDLPYDLMEAWLRDAAGALRLAAEALPPATPIAWHTQHYPQANATTGRNTHQPLGRRAHVTQLNAAGRQVCAAHQGCHLVDVELMTAQWADPRSYLQTGDIIHESDSVANATLNMYLNILAGSHHRSSMRQGTVL